jgi:phosphoribosylformylglycinamidine cyclo-ligase
MKRAFNNGIGLIAVVPEKVADEVLDRLKGMEEKAFLVGEVIKRPEDDERIQWISSDEFKACR